MERLAAWLELRPGMRIADLGAGDGTFALAVARRVGPSGVVYATKEALIKEVTAAGFQVVRGPEPWRGRLYGVLFARR